MARDYIHGFSVAERQRLIEQADILAPKVFSGMDLASVRNLLEIGCGVGAELKHLARRWPGLRLIGMDLSPSHLGAAAGHLAEERAAGTLALVRGNAFLMPFAEGSFDCALTIWMLEHVRDPASVLREALRVLRPGGLLICTEVDNSTFAFTPSQPLISDWWERFNHLQQRSGDPFVGGRLANLAANLEADEIKVTAVPVISSEAEPEHRLKQLDYLEDLLLSGAASMIRAGLASPRQRAATVDAFARVRTMPQIEFRYAAVRMSCRRP